MLNSMLVSVWSAYNGFNAVLHANKVNWVLN